MWSFDRVSQPKTAQLHDGLVSYARGYPELHTALASLGGLNTGKNIELSDLLDRIDKMAGRTRRRWDDPFDPIYDERHSQTKPRQHTIK
jgi:hypothetical protein